MRVALNAWSLNSPHTGIASYTRNLAMALRDLGGVELMLFYGFSWSPALREAPVPGMGAMKALVKRLLPDPYGLTRAIQQVRFTQGVGDFKPELYHEPSFLPFRFAGPMVVTVHDLSPIRYPDTHPGARVQELKKRLPAAIASASAVIVDSDFVRREVIGHFGVDPDRVTAIHLGVSGAFRPRSASDIAPILQKHGLRHRGYVLAVGTLEPRKNLMQAINAHAELPERIRRSTHLVIAGMKGWLARELEARIRVAEERGEVRWLGYVPPSDLPLLYAGAQLFVYPSLYEGFGLPVLEAMASGVPVITSNQASLPEVAGEAAIMVDPRNRNALREAMLRLIEDKAEVRRRSELGLAQAAKFTWRACAENTLAVYRKALQATGQK
jgi:alpha-1,3-rhamnosyl/mannosyltransferase